MCHACHRKTLLFFPSFVEIGYGENGELPLCFLFVLRVHATDASKGRIHKHAFKDQPWTEQLIVLLLFHETTAQQPKSGICTRYMPLSRASEHRKAAKLVSTDYAGACTCTQHGSSGTTGVKYKVLIMLPVIIIVTGACMPVPALVTRKNKTQQVPVQPTIIQITRRSLIVRT